MSKFTKYLVAFAAILSAGMTWAEGEVAVVAKIGTTEYTDLHAAFSDLGSKATATAGYKLELIADVELTSGLTLTDNNTLGQYPAVPISGTGVRLEWYQIDLGGHTISLSGEGYVLTLAGTSVNSTIMIKNGTLKATGSAYGALKADSAALLHTDNLTLTSTNDSYYTVDMGAKSITGLLKNSVVTNTGKGGAVRYTGRQGFIHSSKITCEKGVAVYAELSDENYGGLAIAGTTEATVIKGSTAIYVGENSVQVSYIAGGTIDGKLIDGDPENAAGMLVAFGGTYTQTPEDFLSEGYSIQGEGPYVIHDESALSIDGTAGTKTVAEAFNLGTTSCTTTIALQSDVYLVAIQAKSNLIDVKNGQNLTIDLNGHTLNCFDLSAAYTEVHLCNVANGGTLTVTDSTAESSLAEDQSGELAFASWAPDHRKTPGYANNLFTIGGKMIYERGILRAATWDVMGLATATYCVDANVNYAADITISGGGMSNGNTAIRLFGGKGHKLAVKGGTIDAGNSSLWIQGNASSKVDVKITGGKMLGRSSFGSLSDWNYGNIYGSGTPGGTVSISGTAEIMGSVTCWGVLNTPFITISGGKFVNEEQEDGTRSEYRIWSSANNAGRIVVTGGEFERSYLYPFNYMRLYPNYEGYYITVNQSANHQLMINNDGNYAFGDPAACVTCQYLWYDNTIYPCNTYSQYMSSASTYYSDDSDNGSYILDRYESLTAALKDCGQEMQVRFGNFWLIGQNVKMLKNDENKSVATYYYNTEGVYQVPQLVETRVDMNGCSVTSEATDSLVKVYARGLPPTLKVVGGGSITSGGKIFEIATQGNVEIYGGDYTTMNANGMLFANKGDYKVNVMADVGDGSYFDVNPASFSHDVSDFVYNKDNNITFKTINANDARYYLGRVVEVQDAPAK